MTLAVQVTRVGQPALDLNDHKTYAILSIGLPDTLPDNTVVESPWAHGGTKVGGRLPMTIAKLKVRCYGANAGAALTAADTLRKAIALSYAFEVVITLDGWSKRWQCYSGNVSPSITGQKAQLGWVDVDIQLPLQPETT